MKKYTIGIDFGTLSARALIADAENGNVLPFVASFDYPHGVMTELCAKTLPSGYALQHPRDYIDALDALIPQLLENNSIEGEQIAGIGIDFTACTVLPLGSDGTPLCFEQEFEDEPHAYAKLWKHTGAQKYSERIESIAKEYGDMIKISGGILSSEFMIPKIYETFTEAREVYDSTFSFVNAGDYIASELTGNTIHSMSYATIKEHYDNAFGKGFPPREFYAKIDPLFADMPEKLGTDLTPVGISCGTLTKKWADRLGLCTHTAIATPIIDAHGAFGAAGIEDGRVIAALGTSAVIAVLSKNKRYVPAIHSHGYEATAPGLMTFEAGIRAMGDLYSWFVKRCLPKEYFEAAQENGMGIHAYLRSLAQKLKIGENGLIALDWWNGNRSVIPDDELSGMIVGLRLSTRPEEIYRALIEASAFELRRVCENYEEHGLSIKSVVATGGIAAKDPMFMQILADVLKKDVEVLSSSEATALGSAVFGAAAAGLYPSVAEASAKMKQPIARTYTPTCEDSKAYDKLYERYVRLYDYFGKTDDVMKFLYNFKNKN